MTACNWPQPAKSEPTIPACDATLPLLTPTSFPAEGGVVVARPTSDAIIVNGVCYDRWGDYKWLGYQEWIVIDYGSHELPNLRGELSRLYQESGDFFHEFTGIVAINDGEQVFLDATYGHKPTLLDKKVNRHWKTWYEQAQNFLPTGYPAPIDPYGRCVAMSQFSINLESPTPDCQGNMATRWRGEGIELDWLCNNMGCTVTTLYPIVPTDEEETKAITLTPTSLSPNGDLTYTCSGGTTISHFNGYDLDTVTLTGGPYFQVSETPPSDISDNYWRNDPQDAVFTGAILYAPCP